MKKIMFFIVWIFILSFWQVDAKEETMYFENGLWITEVPSQLTIKLSENESFALYHNQNLMQKVTSEDLEKLGDSYYYRIDPKETGWYYAVNDEKQVVAKALWMDHDEPVFGSDILYRQVGDILVYNEPVTIFIVANQNFDLFDQQAEQYGQWKIWTQKLDEEKLYELAVGNKKWQVYLDRTAPQISLQFSQEPTTVQGNCYFFNDPNTILTIERKDVSDAVFPLDEPWEKKSDGYMCELSLENGMNDCTSYFKDIAGNIGHDPVKMILDTSAPSVNLPNEEMICFKDILTIQLQEENIDWDQTEILWDDVSMNDLQQNDQSHYTFSCDQSGFLKIHVLDLAGNKMEKEWYLVKDSTPPSVQAYVKQGKCFLDIQDPYLDYTSLQSISLYEQNEEIPLQLAENGCTAAVKNDGIYHWLGEVKDKAGNVTKIDEQVVVDITGPRIIASEISSQIYTAPVQLTWQFEDRFLKFWQVDVYRNDTYIESFHGTDTSFSLTLDDTAYEDGYGEYCLVVNAQDTLHSKELTQVVRMDMSCAPLHIWINQTQADLVTALKIMKPTTFRIACIEGQLSWQLYQKNDLIKEGRTHDFVLFPGQQATHLVITCQDDFGHEKKQVVHLSYEKSEDIGIFDGEEAITQKQWQLQNDSIIVQATSGDRVEVYVDDNPLDITKQNGQYEIPIQDGKTHQVEIHIRDEVGKKEEYHLQVQRQKSRRYWLWALGVGGMAIAINIIRRAVTHYIRNHRETKCVLGEQTTVLDDRTVRQDFSDSD